MDAGLAVKPVVSVVASDHVQPVAAVTTAAPTELPVAKTVSPAANGAAVRNDQPLTNPTTRDVVIDAQSREVIYRVLDARSRQVVRQVPEEALLRMRAYTRAIAQGQSPQQAFSKADLIA
jgi:hypothetical protein